jgi:hypothetical protein
MLNGGPTIHVSLQPTAGWTRTCKIAQKITPGKAA